MYLVHNLIQLILRQFSEFIEWVLRYKWYQITCTVFCLIDSHNLRKNKNVSKRLCLNVQGKQVILYGRGPRKLNCSS